MTFAYLTGCGKKVLEASNDLTIALCDTSTHAKVTKQSDFFRLFPQPA
jgi:hypothetical protein